MANCGISNADAFYFRGSLRVDLKLGWSYPIYLNTIFLWSCFFGNHLSSFFNPHFFADQPGENFDTAYGHSVQRKTVSGRTNRAEFLGTKPI